MELKTENEMLILILNYGPYEFAGKVKYRIHRLKGIIRLLEAAYIPHKLNRIPFCNRFIAELAGQTVYTCALSNMDFNGDGSDFNTVTAFEAIQDAFESAKRFFYRKDENRIIFQEKTGEKCYFKTFDSFYVESFFHCVRKPPIVIENGEDEIEISEKEEKENKEGEINKKGKEQIFVNNQDKKKYKILRKKHPLNEFIGEYFVVENRE